MGVSLETKNLIIRTLDERYAKKTLKYYDDNKDFFKEYDPLRSPNFYTISEQVKILYHERQQLRKGKDIRLYISLKEEDKLIGCISLSNIVGGAFMSCYLGYKLHKDYLRQGYMEEALMEVIDYAFKTLKLHRIEANIMPNNEASIKLVEKLNFKREGLAPKYLKINGAWEDHIHYSLINDKL